jgi:Camelysin metallo-endopeptidase
MSRFKVLRANPRRALAALATVLVAVGVTVASGASFTASTANASNTFTAGTLTMSNDHAGAILTASNMKPGDATTNATGTVVIKNTGSLAGTFTLKRSALTNSDTTNPMANKLNMTITDCGADQDCLTTTDNSNVYTGTLAAMSSVITLGTPWAASAQHTYKFVAALDVSADDNYQGDNAVATFQWDAA